MPYTIGLDYGSLSCRGVLADVKDGHIVAQAEMAYSHGILDRALPDGTPLRGSWCLQHPGDYTEALERIVPELLESSGIPKEAVIGIGVDFTASTVIPLDEQFRPLCERFPSRPHAWPKLWKHHGAVAQAEKLTEAAKIVGYLERYGGKISSECLTAKVIQIFEEDREIYDAAGSFVEAMDYVTSLLCGAPVFGGSVAAAKAFYSREAGYPPKKFFGSVRPELEDLPKTKLAERFDNAVMVWPYEKAGSLCPEMAEKLGLCPGIAVAGPQMDAYAAMPGLGIARPGVMMLVIGTSTGMMLLSRDRKPVEGITACLRDTYYPGLWGYGSGQASVGDAFGWFAQNCVPETYAAEARRKGVSAYQYLTELAGKMAPGETGLIALDWLGGNRSCLGNPNLSGMILGLTLQTRPEHIYRALLEATAFGVRTILDAYRGAEVPIDEIRACGGIPGKNPLLMQIYADVLGLPIHVSACTQAPALGSAIYAAAAAGCGDIFRMVESMGDQRCRIYEPNPENKAAYDWLYEEYTRLHDYFGRGTNRIMEKLREKGRSSQ